MTDPRNSAWSTARAVFSNELRCLVRDRRAIAMAFLLPLVLIPLLLAGRTWLEDLSSVSTAQRRVRIALDLRALDASTSDRLRALLEEEDPIELVDADASGLADLEPLVETGTPRAEELEREAVHRVLASGGDALIVARRTGSRPPAALRVFFDETDDQSSEARVRVDRALDRLQAEADDPRAASTSSRAADAPRDSTDGARAGQAVEGRAGESGGGLARMFPWIAVLVLLSGGSYAALAAFAGEREAGTLETLFVQPAPALAVAVGKLAVVVATSVATLALSAACLACCAAFGLWAPGSFSLVASDAASTSLATRVLIAGVVFAPAVIQLSVALCAVSARAKTFREGQHSLMPLMLLAIVPTLLATQRDLELDWLLAAIPLAGPSLALRDALHGDLDLSIALWMLTVQSVEAWFALRFLARTLDAERLLQTPRTFGEDAAQRTQSRRALQWTALAVILVYVVGAPLQSASLILGVIVTQVVIVSSVAWCSIRGTAKRARESLREALWLERPTALHLIGALALAPCLAELTPALLAWQSRALPLPSGFESSQFARDVLALSPLARVALFALLPAVCEELLFRGALLSGLRRDRSTLECVLWQALLFGAVHASIFRFLPTAIVGAVLTLVTLRTRSLFPAVLLHAAYNACILQREAFAGGSAWIVLAAAAGFLCLASAPPIRAVRVS